MLRAPVQRSLGFLRREPRFAGKRTIIRKHYYCPPVRQNNFENILPGGDVGCKKQNFCTKTFSEESSSDLIDATLTDTTSEFEGGFWAGTDDDLTQFRIKLYPDNPDPILTTLFDAESIQAVLDIVESINPHTFSEKHSSQALISLWDLQKLFFRIGPSFDPVKDFTNRKAFVELLRSHPTFSKKILEHVLNHASILEAEPLAACLLCLKRLDYCMRSEPCQLLIEECRRRRGDFPLPALSRLAVCLRSESIYGSLIMVEFLPHLMTCVNDMENEFDVRLASIALKSVHRLASSAMVQLYRKNIRNILSKYYDGNADIEAVTFCKILLCLLDTRSFEAVSLETSPRVLIREIGKCLAERSDEMTVVDILSLHRFLENGPQEPAELIDAMFSRISSLIDKDGETPRLDLMTCIGPFVKNLGQRQRLANYIRQYLDEYPQFEPVSHVLLRILKIVKLNDTELYDKYWSKVTELLRNNSKSFETSVRPALQFGIDYLGFTHAMVYSYHNEEFEREVKNLLYTYFENYYNLAQPTFIYQSDIVKAMTFLIAFSDPSDPVFSQDRFFNMIHDNPQLKVSDLHLIARGIDASHFLYKEAWRNNSNYFNKIMDLSSKIEESVCTKLLEDRASGNRLTTSDCVAISKLYLSMKRAFGDSPVLHDTIKRWTIGAETESIDSKLGREMATTLLCSNYNSPAVYKMLEDFICENKGSISTDFAEKFICYAYASGYETNPSEPEDSNVFRICHDVLEAHMTQIQPYGILQCAQALCFAGSLQSSFVNRIFSVPFMDRVDGELACSVGYGSSPLRVRQAFMELNRAVCIDMPDSNVPWFHEKFCEDVISANYIREQYMQKEINMVLGEVLNDPAFVKRDVYSPYFYLLDFLIEFDNKGRPIKTVQKRRSIFSRASDNVPVEVGRKVAILVLPRRAYTRNVRQLKGFYKLRRRHLEILGYQVIEIDPQLWNSMYMSEPMAKNDYLENSIFPRSERPSKAGSF